MKVKLPCDISPYQKEQITKHLYEYADNEIIKAQIIWIKYACITLAKSGFSEEQILLFLGNFFYTYKQNKKFNNTEEQDEWISKQLKKYMPNSSLEQMIEAYKKI